MTKKKLIVLLVALILSFSFAASSAWAGSRHRHRMQGVAIGLGAAIIGGALLHNYSRDHHQTVDYNSCPPPVYDPPSYGYWEIKRIWVPPTHQRYWRRGHHNHRGYWVPGRWDHRIDRPGFWKEKRIWVSDGHRKHRKHHRRSHYFAGQYGYR